MNPFTNTTLDHFPRPVNISSAPLLVPGESSQDRQVCKRVAKLLNEHTQGICTLYVQHCLREPIDGEIIASPAPDVALLLKPTSAPHHALSKVIATFLGKA